MSESIRMPEERFFSADTGMGVVYRGIIREATYRRTLERGEAMRGEWRDMETEVNYINIDMTGHLTEIEIDTTKIDFEKAIAFAQAIRVIYPEVNIILEPMP